mgnify:CR=1 FL=1
MDLDGYTPDLQPLRNSNGSGLPSHLMRIARQRVAIRWYCRTGCLIYRSKDLNISLQ